MASRFRGNDKGELGTASRFRGNDRESGNNRGVRMTERRYELNSHLSPLTSHLSFSILGMTEWNKEWISLTLSMGQE